MDNFEFSFFFHNASQMFCILGKNGHFKKLNQAWELAVGWSVDELIAMPWLEFVHPGDRERIVHDVARLSNGQETTDICYRFLCKDTSFKWFKWRAVCKNKEIFAVVETFHHDEMPRRGDQCDQVQQTIEQIHPLIAHIPAAVAMFDREMHYISYSNQWLIEYGMEETSLIGKKHGDVFPQIKVDWCNIFQRVLSGEAYRSDRDFFVRPDGKNQWLRWFVRPWYQGNKLCGAIMFSQDITPEVQAEERIRLEKEKLEAVADNIPVMLSIYNRDGTLEWVNPYWEKALGWELKELADWDNLVKHYPDLKHIGNASSSIISKERGWHDIQVRTKRGDIIHTSWANAKLSSGKTISFGLDITDRINSKRRIEQSELETRAILEASPDYIVLLDTDFKIKYVNHVAVDFEGVNLIGRSFLEFVPEDSRSLVLEHMTKSLASASMVSFETEARGPDGKVLWNHTRIVPLILGKGRVEELMLVSQDITPQHEADERIRTLASLIEASEDVYLYCTPDGRPIYFNDSAKKHFGWSEDIHSVCRFVPADVWEKYTHEVLPYITNTDKQWEGEVYLIDLHTGARVPVWQRIFCMKDKDGKILYYATVATDLSQKKANEIRMIQASKMVTLGEMAGGVAHEINNPLALIQAAARKIKRELETKGIADPQVMATVNIIETATLRIGRVTRALLAYARDNNHEGISTVKVADMMNDILGFSAERIKNKRIKLKIEPIPSSLTLECRPIQLTQALLNLISNSFDAVEDLDEKWIRIEVNDFEDVVEFAVCDSGLGIPDDIRGKLMDPFFTTKAIGRGTGLGLSVAAGIAQNHGGTLTYDSSSKNTRFVLRLPKNQNSAALDSSPPCPAPS